MGGADGRLDLRRGIPVSMRATVIFVALVVGCGASGYEAGRAGSPIDLVTAAAAAVLAARAPDPEHVAQPPIEGVSIGSSDVPRFSCTTTSGTSDVILAEDDGEARAICEQLGDEPCRCVLEAPDAAVVGPGAAL